jgi:hypothetical protein
MIEREAEQINRLLSYRISIAQRIFEDRLNAIYADHSAKGRLHSGGTIKVAIRLMGEMGTGLVSALADEVLAVSPLLDGHAALSHSIEELADFFAGQLPRIVAMAAGRMPASQPDDAVKRAAEERFDAMRRDLIEQVGLLAFRFKETSSLETDQSKPAASKKGGRPPAEFWDDMWATIAVQLFEGSLQPKAQADVERAMAIWIEGSGYSAADSTIRARARRLWDRISAAEG